MASTTFFLFFFRYLKHSIPARRLARTKQEKLSLVVDNMCVSFGQAVVFGVVARRTGANKRWCDAADIGQKHNRSRGLSDIRHLQCCPLYAFFSVDEIFFWLIRRGRAVALGALAFALFASYNPRPSSLPARLRRRFNKLGETKGYR